MPVSSQLQRRAMYAAAEGKSKIGIPASVGRDFIAASHGITGLPKRAPDPKAKRKHIPGSLAPGR